MKAPVLVSMPGALVTVRTDAYPDDRLPSHNGRPAVVDQAVRMPPAGAAGPLLPRLLVLYSDIGDEDPESPLDAGWRPRKAWHSPDALTHTRGRRGPVELLPVWAAR